MMTAASKSEAHTSSSDGNDSAIPWRALLSSSFFASRSQRAIRSTSGCALNSGMNPCANAPVPTIATLIPISLLPLRGSSSYQRMLMFLTRVWLSNSSNDSSLPIPLCFQPP